MPKRTDINRILIIGSGPIIIGQAGEFDYSGSQAIKALKALGYYIVVINSNPATIMTDPALSNKVYIEPITPEIIEQIIVRDKIEAILPTVGGQTALNVTLQLADRGIIDKYGLEVLGANANSIRIAENRELFRKLMDSIGLKSPLGKIVRSLKEAKEVAQSINYPIIIRPSFTMGGSGGGVATNDAELEEIILRGLTLSPIGELLLEESLIGWKEYEYEIMRDSKDNAVIVSTIENFDPMGIHTGDSITVAPAQTLSDKEYQILRDYSIEVIRKVGVATGGSNIQFAVNPRNGEVRIIEMNPRVSRSSALVSKATGFPIAKIAAQLAVGLTLDEIQNEMTGSTPASFEPALDYIVVKIPRWDFEKFKVSSNLTTQMKSVGEVMSIGSNFREALQKSLRSLEIGVSGLDFPAVKQYDDEKLIEKLKVTTPMRIFVIKEALKRGYGITKIFEYTHIDPWFLHNIKQICDMEEEVDSMKIDDFTSDSLRKLKLSGFSDKQISQLTGSSEADVRAKRKELGVFPVYKKVDTCAAEFEAKTSYYYSTYMKENESVRSERRKIIVLGGGPFRIGQGIEFDYCASQASMALKNMGIETIMINCNPETVSTDYDTSDKLYFEPVFFEDIMNIIELEQPDGVILQLGGQTPLKLSARLEAEGINILGTSQQNMDRAEDRGRFLDMLKKLKIPFPPGDIAYNPEDAIKAANKIKYPVIVRPSYVLGGRGMVIVYNEEDLKIYFKEAARISEDHPALIDKFLENAYEVDVDAICDGEKTIIAGIMQHIEEAGVHSGDSSCVLPAYLVEPHILDKIRSYTYKLAKELNIIGFINIQFAALGEEAYIIEVNPRASRTIPFVSKATGIQLTRAAVKAMLGEKLEDMNIPDPGWLNYFAVKAPVFSFSKFPGVDPALGPEMRSTGEVMGVSEFFGEAYVKSQISAGNKLPKEGNVFISVNDHDKQFITPVARRLESLGYKIFATLGTFSRLHVDGIKANFIPKIGEGSPNVVDRIKNGDIHLIINTPLGGKAYQDDIHIREAALEKGVLCITSIHAAKAAADGLEWLQNNQISVYGAIRMRD